MKKFVIAFGWALIACAYGFAAPEVVLTTPLETDLGVTGAKDTAAVWIDMIAKAKSTLDIEQFYISDEKGEALEPVLAEIHKAAARGVKVRLVVDKKFFETYPDSVKELGALENAEAKTIDFDKLTGGVQHAKFMVVDGSDLYVGSANFDWRALAHIHEVGLRVSDAALAGKLTAIFNKDFGGGMPTLDEMGALPSTLELLGSPKGLLPADIPFSFDRITELLQNAHKSIKIQVYEYSSKVYGSKETWLVLNDLLIDAAKRGVKVDLVVDSTDMSKAKSDLQALAKVKNITVRTVKIPEFSGGAIEFARLIHSKYLLVDGTTYWVGTDNWSKSYFYNSRGASLVGGDAGTLGILNQIFEKVQTSAFATLLK